MNSFDGQLEWVKLSELIYLDEVTRIGWMKLPTITWINLDKLSSTISLSQLITNVQTTHIPWTFCWSEYN